MTLVILVADGARPDTLFAAIDAGHLPALARLRTEGSAHTITSVFPSVTGAAYVPFLLGLHPGCAGLPGVRWWDRARDATRWPGHARSYVGFEALRADRDLIGDHPTLFECAERPLGAFTPIGRGLRGRQRVGASLPFGLRLAWTHFRGDWRAWQRFDRELGLRMAERVRHEKPDLAFIALPGIDKMSHHAGHESTEVLEAMRAVDATVERLLGDAERDGRAQDLELWVVSDHGHSPVLHHEDLAGQLASWGIRVLAHPWISSPRAEAAVMVSGNAMAHIHLELAKRERPWWPALAARWTSLVGQLLERDSVDLVLLPHSPQRCEVRARGRGGAMVTRDADGRYTYRPETGDPLGLAPALGAGGTLEGLTATEVHALTFSTDYPDSLVQILALTGSGRAGEIIVSAARGWDLRSRYEPIPHRSTHGALLREHLLVPLLLSRPANGTPRRTVDVFPSALGALGQTVPDGIDGTSFR